MKRILTRIVASQRTIRMLLGLCMLGALSGGCLTMPLSRTNTDAELVVGVAPDSVPFFGGNPMAPVGLEVDLARKLADRLGQTVRFAVMKQEDLLEAVDTGRIDIIMSGLVVTRETTKRVSFSRPYLRDGQVLVTRTDDARAVTPAAVRGLQARVGVVRDSRGEAFVRAHCLRATAVIFRSGEKALQALAAGKVDAAVLPAVQASVLSAQVPGITVGTTPLTRSDVAWAVDTVNFDLLDAANAARAEWLRDGTLAATIETWVPRYNELGLAE